MFTEMTVNEKDFAVKKLLGKGKGGYSWLVSDGEGEYVLKQIHHEPCDYYTFGDKLASELRDYRILRDLGLPVPEMLDVDTAQERILKEYIPGDTVFDLVLRDEMQPDHLAQVGEMCRMLYAAGLNIDYFPTNFVVRGGKLHYVDYECNPYMAQWDFETWGIRYWSKTPELLDYVKQHS
jgi:predicted Ser/Thr protein kinase